MSKSKGTLTPTLSQGERGKDSPDTQRRLTHPSSFILHPSRCGFTLIEIMVVVGIIALLAALSLVAFRGFVGDARVDATKATIQKIDKILQQRMDAYNRWIDSQKVSAPEIPDYVYQSDLQALGWTSGNPISDSLRDTAIVLARKNRFREFFPQIISEVPSGGTFPGSVTNTTNENAECLYYIIMNAQVFGAEATDDGVFIDAEVADADGDGLKEFVDSWGNPIRFYRWPTRLMRPGSGSPPSIDLTQGATLLMGTIPTGDSQSEDPDDPLGLLPYAVSNGATIDASTHHDLDTYHVPLVISVGPDGAGPEGGGLGLYEPTDTSNLGNLAQPIAGQSGMLTDNITNLNVRVGGGR